MVLLLLLILALLAVIVIFAFPAVSPIPYYPSRHRDLGLIAQAMDLHDGQTVVDLGAGDGTVVFFAASQAQRQRLRIKFVAIEINPILVMALLIRRLFHPAKKNIQVVWADFFRWQPNPANERVFYLYGAPWLNDKIANRLRQFPGKNRLVSYYYPVAGLTAQQRIQGINRIFVYQLGRRRQQ
ncbi:hypothetical protein M1523_00260 [Patescibacteria group bacterium]|nr:hypothetical protein [Patescibacteria group bacterium]MCL5091930.1 hypothetical protein [Patescibacteria group bacterium]